METKNETIIKVTKLICHTVIVLFISYYVISLIQNTQRITLIKSLKTKSLEIKDKELDFGLKDSYLYCVKMSMEKSKENNKQITLQEAEKVCDRLKN